MVNAFKFLSIWLSFIVLTGCIDIGDLDNTKIDTSDISAAIPLVNTQLSLGTISDRFDANGNTSISIDPQGRATILYSGDIVRRNASAIFPVFPTLNFDIPILGNNSTFNLESLESVTSAFENNIIRKAFFQENFVDFKLQHAEAGPVTFDITIPEWTLDGEPFRMSYIVPPRENDQDIYITPQSPLDGYLFLPNDNSLQFIYTATDSAGEEVDMTFTSMRLDFLNFSYVEGYFGTRVFDIEGDVIAVGLFDKWISGGLEFEDPKLRIRVENSFGFPVKTDFKELRINTVTNNIYDVESIIIDEGIDFNFPTLDEVGEIKITEFDFNKDNSNLQQIFTDKVSSVSYDIDALANPDADPEINGFLNKESYFLINVNVELPLKGIIKELVVTDTVSIDIAKYDEVDSGEFKFVLRNDFPAEVELQAFVLDENEEVIDVLFEDEGLILEAADLGADGRTIPGSPTVQYLEVDNIRYNNIRNGAKIALIAKIDSEQVSSEYLWLYDDYSIDFKLGAILNLSE